MQPLENMAIIDKVISMTLTSKDNLGMYDVWDARECSCGSSAGAVSCRYRRFVFYGASMQRPGDHRPDLARSSHEKSYPFNYPAVSDRTAISSGSFHALVKRMPHAFCSFPGGQISALRIIVLVNLLIGRSPKR